MLSEKLFDFFRTSYFGVHHRTFMVKITNFNRRKNFLDQAKKYQIMTNGIKAGRLLKASITYCLFLPISKQWRIEARVFRKKFLNAKNVDEKRGRFLMSLNEFSSMFYCRENIRDKAPN